VRAGVRRVAEAVSPGLAAWLRTVSQRRHLRQFERSLGLPALVKKYVLLHGSTVKAGPFKGLRYPLEAAGSTLLPKLVGAYESELHPIIQKISSAGYTTVVDIGCAEGYYAVGLACRLPLAHVHAFDIDAEARHLCRKTARLNGALDRVTIHGRCDQMSLTAKLPSTGSSPARALVICDAEGFEVDLLDVNLVPRLRHVDLLVELHDCFRSGATDILLERFRKSHCAEVITSTEREPANYEALQNFTLEEQQLALNEFRHGVQRWVYFQAV
jgi:hypothetical protein